VHQVAGFADQVPFLGGAVLNDHDPFEVDPEVLDPFLYRFFDTRVKTFCPISKPPQSPSTGFVHSKKA
jgi:hypothetical protein